MNKLILFTILSVALIACTPTHSKKKLDGVLPPAYLSVEHWEQCLAEQEMQSNWKSVCIPSSKPSNCPEPSWQMLKHDKSLLSCN